MHLELVRISVEIAIFSVVFSCILIEDDMIFEFYGKLIRKLPAKLCEPLGGCPYCFGGQVALWYYLYRVFFLGYRYDFLVHVSFITITIFLIHLILFIYERTS